MERCRGTFVKLGHLKDPRNPATAPPPPAPLIKNILLPFFARSSPILIMSGRFLLRPQGRGSNAMSLLNFPQISSFLASFVPFQGPAFLRRVVSVFFDILLALPFPAFEPFPVFETYRFLSRVPRSTSQWVSGLFSAVNVVKTHRASLLRKPQLDLRRLGSSFFLVIHVYSFGHDVSPQSPSLNTPPHLHIPEPLRAPHHLGFSSSPRTPPPRARLNPLSTHRSYAIPDPHDASPRRR